MPIEKMTLITMDKNALQRQNHRNMKTKYAAAA